MEHLFFEGTAGDIFAVEESKGKANWKSVTSGKGGRPKQAFKWSRKKVSKVLKILIRFLILIEDM